MDILGGRGEGGDSLLSCLMYRHSMKKVRTLAVAGHLNGHLWGGRGDSLLRCLIYRQSVRKVRTVVVAGHLNTLGGGG